MSGLHPVVIVTGALGSIGSATASALARGGAQVVLMARPSDRLEAAVKALNRHDGRATSVPVDLSSMASVRDAAREVARTVDRVDALLNVAAIFTREYRKTPDGFETMLATNHLGPFLLTNLLRDGLTGGGRVITVTAPSTTRVVMDQLLSKKAFSPLRTFGATKAAGLLFTFELARRAARWDVRANAYHPGLVRSQLMQEASAPVRLLTRIMSRPAGRAAADLAELAISPAYQGTTGWFFRGTRRIDPPASTRGELAQGELWRRSKELVDLDTDGF